MRRGRTFTMTAIWALALCSMLCLLILAADKNLYPRCGGQEVSAQAAGGHTASLQKIIQQPSELIISCLAIDVTPIGVDGASLCAVSHQTEYNYRVFIRATFTDSGSGQDRSVDYDVKDVMGGSSNRIHITLPSEGRFELFFANLAADSQCVLKARALLETESGTGQSSDNPVPVLVGISPAVLYKNRHAYTYFIFRHIASAGTAAVDSVRLIASSKKCDDPKAKEGALALTLTPDDSSAYATLRQSRPDPSALSVWQYFFETSGTFRLCYQQGSSNSWMESAMISVFGGNPSYYTFEHGQGPQGQIYIGREVKVRFHGYGLDTRPTGDQAKFVAESDTCEGPAAGGVQVATDLGPADDWGPNTKFTDWSWTLLQVGAYKICYKRKDHEWTEVPNLMDLGPGAVDVTQAPQAPVPTPTDPLTHEDCPMAPNGAENRLNYPTYVKITLDSPTTPAGYLSSLSLALCIPQWAFSVVRQSHSSNGQKTNLWLDITCSPLAGTTATDVTPPCNAQERKNYIVSLADTKSSLLRTLQLDSAVFTSQDEIFAVDDSHGSAAQRSHVALIVGCLTLIIVTALIVFAVIKYKEKQHYFIQFGVDEDDVPDDELEIDADGAVQSKKVRHVPDATIELEMEE